MADVLDFALNNTNFDGNEFKHLLVLVLGGDERLQAEITEAVRASSRAE